MLDLAMGGRAVGGGAAVAFFEALLDSLPDEMKTEDFCNQYTYALNRFRYEARKSVPVAPKTHEGRSTYYTCGQCGRGVDCCTDKYCSGCGGAIDWRNL